MIIENGNEVMVKLLIFGLKIGSKNLWFIFWRFTQRDMIIWWIILITLFIWKLGKKSHDLLHKSIPTSITFSARFPFICLIVLILLFESPNLIGILFLKILTCSTILLVLIFLGLKSFFILTSQSKFHLFFRHSLNMIPTNINLRIIGCHLISMYNFFLQHTDCNASLFFLLQVFSRYLALASWFGEA